MVLPDILLSWRSGLQKRRGEVLIPMENVYPNCQKCSIGVLIPLSDYGKEGAPIVYKAWVCTNPECGFNIRIDNGEVSIGRLLGRSDK